MGCGKKRFQQWPDSRPDGGEGDCEVARERLQGLSGLRGLIGIETSLGATDIKASSSQCCQDARSVWIFVYIFSPQILPPSHSPHPPN